MRSHASVERVFGPRPQIADLGGRSVRGGLAMLVANVGSRAVRFAAMLLLARLLTPADFGVFAVVMAFTGVAGLLSELGLATATIQRSELTQQQVSTLFWVNVGAGAAMTCLALLAAPWLGRLYGDERITLAFELLAFKPLLGALGVQHKALIQRAMRFRHVAAIGLLSAAAGALAAVLLALRGHAFVALVIGTLISSALASALCWLLFPWRPGRPRLDSDAVKMLSYGSYLVGFGFLATIGTGLHSMLLGWIGGAESTGLYQRAFTLAQLFQGLTLGSVAAVTVAALAHLQDRPDEFRHHYLRCATFLVTLCAPVAAAGALFSGELMLVLFGAQWAASAPVFAILSIGVVFYTLSYSTGWIYVAMGRTATLLRWGLAGWSCVIAGTLIGLPFGLRGLAIAQTATVVLIFVPCMALAFHGTRLTLGDLARAVWRPLASALAAAVATTLALRALPEAALPRLLAGSTVFGATYLAVLSEALGQRPQLVGFARELFGRARVVNAS